MSTKRLDGTKKAAAQDTEQVQLRRIILEGWPEYHGDVPEMVQPYFNYRGELVVFDDLIFKGERLHIPSVLRPEILDITDGAHMGVQSCLRKACDAVFWPRLNTAMKNVVEQCEICEERSRAQPKEPLINHPLPQQPWQMIGCDLISQYGQDYLQYSGL